MNMTSYSRLHGCLYVPDIARQRIGKRFHATIHPSFHAGDNLKTLRHVGMHRLKKRGFQIENSPSTHYISMQTYVRSKYSESDCSCNRMEMNRCQELEKVDGSLFEIRRNGNVVSFTLH